MGLNRKRIFANMLSVIALILVLVSILIICVQYPSCWMLMVCIGAALYIYAGFSAIELPLVNKFFSINIIVAIRLISYSLYLWDWPIIAYVNYLSIEKTTVVKIVILLLSFALSIFSYYLVENPLRFKYKFSILKTLGLLWLLPMISKWAAGLNMTTLVAGGTRLAVYNIIQDKKIEKYIEVWLDKTHPKYVVLAGWWNLYTVHAKLPKDNRALFFYGQNSKYA